MLNNTQGDLGAAVFQTWPEEQKRAEIGRLVEGYRAGVPVGILCKMTETIAGNRKKAKKYLAEFMNEEERRAAVEKETGGMRQLVAAILL